MSRLIQSKISKTFSTVLSDKASSSNSVDGEDVSKVNKKVPKKRKLINDRTESKKQKQVKSERANERNELLKVLKEISKEENIFLSDSSEVLDNFVKKAQEICRRDQIDLTEKRIKLLMHYMIRFCDKQRYINDEPIDKWLEQIKALTPQNSHLEQQLKSALMVAIEEPIPEFSNKKINDENKKAIPEPDYNAVYKYLACAVSDLPLPKLSPIDSLLVEDCMQSLIEQIKSLNDSDLRLNLRRIFLFLNKVKGQAPEEEEESASNQLSKGDVLNPLGINQNLIVPVPPE